MPGYPAGEWQSGMMIGRCGVVGRDDLMLADMGRNIGVLTHQIDLSQKRVMPFFFVKMLDRSSAVIASRRPEIDGALVERSLEEKALPTLER